MKSRLLIALALLLPACGGTETGNPNGPSAGNTAATVSFADQLVTGVCSKLAACYPSLSTATCDAGLLTETNFGPALGLPGDTRSLSQLASAEEAGSIAVKSPATCISDIGALSCSSAGVQQAYSASSPSDFSNVVKLVPGSCSTAY
jgi:hypothetical protein